MSNQDGGAIDECTKKVRAMKAYIKSKRTNGIEPAIADQLDRDLTAIEHACKH